MKNNKNIWFGVLLGLVLPSLFVGALNIGLVLFDKYLNTSIFQSALLFGAALNLLLIRCLFKKKKEFLGRGVLLTSFFIFLYWVVRFIILEQS